MELNIKFNEKMLVETANRVLDEFKYNGKTIREWADLIANPKTNADRIRAMPDEELATLISSDWCEIVCGPETNCQYSDCRRKILDWLIREAGDVGQ